MSTSTTISIDKISIRTDIRPGDIGLITWMHGKYYAEENGYGLRFETYVAEGLAEFYRQYDPALNRMWMCEYEGRFIGSLCLMDRGDAAQLRYFFILKEFRGIGLGKRLMDMLMDTIQICGFERVYLWTVKGLAEAAAIYNRYGFIPDDEKISDNFGPGITEQRFLWIKQAL